MAVVRRLAGRVGDFLRSNAARASYDIRNLLASRASRVTLIVVGVSGQEGARHHAGRAANGIDALAHLGTAGMARRAVGRMVRGDNERLVVLLAGSDFRVVLSQSS